MRWTTGLLVVLAGVTGGLAACVGDDPVPSSSSSSGSGSSSSGGSGSSSSGGSGSSSSGGSSSSSSGDGGVTSLVPTTLGSRLVAWFDNDKARFLVPEAGPLRVARWEDRSPAVSNANQPAAEARPLAAVHLGGYRAVFDTQTTLPQALLLGDGPAIQWGNGDFAVFCVCSWPKMQSGRAALWAKVDEASATPEGLVLGFTRDATGNANLLAELGPGLVRRSASAPTDTVLHRFAWVRQANRLAMRVDGAEVYALDGAGQDVTNAGKPVAIGRARNAKEASNPYFLGDVAEIVAVKGALSLAEIQGVELYLKTHNVL
jgi:hypothetical protein